MIEKLQWEMIDTGLGFNRHKSGDYTVEPEDLDQNIWAAWFGGEILNSCIGWQSARKICQNHSDRML